jgi:cytochrome b561
LTIAFILGPEQFGRLMHQGVDTATRSNIIWHEYLGILVFALTVIRLLWIAARPATPQFALTGWMY